MAEDLWPDNIAESTMVTPVSILKEQAALLGEKTKQLVKGEVVTEAVNSPSTPFRQRFLLVAPTIGYRYELLSITYGVNFYPLNITYGEPRTAGQTIPCRSEEEFKAKLKEVLRSQHTLGVVHAILAQVRS